VFFNGAFKKYRPSLSNVKFQYAKGLFNLGVVFFVIQMAGIVQYQTANIIIAQSFSTADVTSYNIVFKYFGVLNMVFVIFLTPFWSASTEAYLKKDIPWIKRSMRKYNQLNFLLFIVGCFMLIFSNSIYRLWLGKGMVNISFYLSLWGFIYFVVTMFAGKYVYFLNGINALRIQFLSSIISPFVYIGLSLLLIKYYKMGVYSLFVASILANFNGYILAPLQYYQVIIKNKKGIWVK
jgi:O-antigen/teichoic acid export membrane protein